MITNFKIFESETNKKYWRIKISDKISNKMIDVQLYKIGMPIQTIEKFDFLHFHTKDILIGFGYKNKYGFNDIDDNFYKDEGFKYMGEVEITEDDIKNYEIAKNQEKYNL